MENTKNYYGNATKAINDSLLTYMKLCNILVGANALSEGNYVRVPRKYKRRRTMKEKWRKNGVATHLLFPTMVTSKFP